MTETEIRAQTTVWIFQGEGQNAVSGCFATQKTAEAWIAQKQLSGVLTAYPLDCPIYDWAIERGYWQPARAYQTQARFIQNFTSAYLPHFHYVAGVCQNEP